MDNEHEYLQKTLKILELVHREEDGGYDILAAAK